jgi:hypothetical protein
MSQEMWLFLLALFNEYFTSVPGFSFFRAFFIYKPHQRQVIFLPVSLTLMRHINIRRVWRLSDEVHLTSVVVTREAGHKAAVDISKELNKVRLKKQQNCYQGQRWKGFKKSLLPENLQALSLFPGQ